MISEQNSQIFRNREFEERVEKYNQLVSKNPNKVPVIFERQKESGFIQADQNVKFFSDKNVEFKKLSDNLRQIWKLKENEALFFSINDEKIINPAKMIGEYYEKYRNDDGFLYIQVDNIDSLG